MSCSLLCVIHFSVPYLSQKPSTTEICNSHQMHQGSILCIDIRSRDRKMFVIEKITFVKCGRKRDSNFMFISSDSLLSEGIKVSDCDAMVSEVPITRINCRDSIRRLGDVVPNNVALKRVISSTLKKKSNPQFLSLKRPHRSV